MFSVLGYHVQLIAMDHSFSVKRTNILELWHCELAIAVLSVAIVVGIAYDCTEVRLLSLLCLDLEYVYFLF